MMEDNQTTVLVALINAAERIAVEDLRDPVSRTPSNVLVKDAEQFLSSMWKQWSPNLVAINRNKE
jgi:hypothetical protein